MLSSPAKAPQGGAVAVPQADASQTGVLCLRKMASAAWGMTQHKDPGGCSFSSLSRAPTLDSTSRIDSLHTPLVHPALHLLEPGLSGCNRDFVCWLFKRLSASPAISLWQVETPLLFTAGYYLGFFPGSGSCSWFCRLGSPAWGLDPTLLRGKSLATEISPQNFSCCPWEPSQSSHTSSTLPTRFIVVKWFLLSVFGFNVSLQLVFSWLFRMIFP